MSRRGITVGLFTMITGLTLSISLVAFGDLSAESEAFCASTAKAETTKPADVIAKVAEAAALLEKEGEAAFPKFQGKDTSFIFDGTYMWIHKLSDATMLMHPIKPKMVGKQWAGLKDKNGKRFFATMNQLCTEEGSAWVEYLWPKPGTSDYVRKISYVKKCTMPDGTDVVIGCGLYNYDAGDLAALNIR